VRWHDVNREKESLMKMHLVIAATMAGLCSHAAFARYDGGDTWSELEPQATTSASQSMRVATTASLSGLQRSEPSVYGTPAEADAADRTVRLGSGAQWINVAYGETVRFTVSGDGGPERSFTWRFDGSPVGSDVDLTEVAPADFPVHDVHVFVAADSRSSGG